MDLFLKGILQGSIPTVVIVGGTHHLVKKFRESKPVLYWGSLLAATGLTYAVVMNKVPAPFMDAENEIDRYYEHREEILEVKARLLEEEDYEDDQEAENDAIYEVFSKYYPEIYESEWVVEAVQQNLNDKNFVNSAYTVLIGGDAKTFEEKSMAIAETMNQNANNESFTSFVESELFSAETFESQRMMTTCDGCGMTEEGHMDYCSYCDMDFCDSCDHFGDFRMRDVCEDSVNLVIETSPYVARKGERR